jgi:septal ring factor EnvC (AmiA/AmiB activator)
MTERERERERARESEREKERKRERERERARESRVCAVGAARMKANRPLRGDALAAAAAALRARRGDLPQACVQTAQ